MSIINQEIIDQFNNGEISETEYWNAILNQVK